LNHEEREAHKDPTKTSHSSEPATQSFGVDRLRGNGGGSPREKHGNGVSGIAGVDPDRRSSPRQSDDHPVRVAHSIKCDVFVVSLQRMIFALFVVQKDRPEPAPPDD
jgi:hypothetical protein